uniref:Uncharacterized protein n=1 Tax=viral metagenome TaxID=1070528 RepID=A0A6M3L5M9_9ZZZZ
MADNLAALKVKIGTRASGHADHPDFNILPIVQVSGMDWSKYIDVYGRGWHYATIGHRDVADDSPIGEQWGMLLIPETFAAQAIAAFPGLCSRLTATEAAAFYDGKVADRFEDEEIDETILVKIKAKRDLGMTLTREDKRALDKRDPTRGIRENRRKRFATYKVDANVNVVDPS